MADSFRWVGQASTMGLTKTSISPPPIAYMATERSSPQKGSWKRSGRKAREIRPAQAKIWARTTLIR